MKPTEISITLHFTAGSPFQAEVFKDYIRALALATKGHYETAHKKNKVIFAITINDKIV